MIDFQDDQPFQGRRGQGGQGANSFIAKYCVNCLKDRFDYPDEDTKPDSFVCPQCKGLHIQKKGGHRANVETSAAAGGAADAAAPAADPAPALQTRSMSPPAAGHSGSFEGVVQVGSEPFSKPFNCGLKRLWP